MDSKFTPTMFRRGEDGRTFERRRLKRRTIPPPSRIITAHDTINQQALLSKQIGEVDMGFDICFNPQIAENLDRARYGIIQIGEFRERFLSSLEYWRESDYERQWTDGIERISVEDASCLITSVRDPARSVAWWTLYRDNDMVYVQNAIRFFRPAREPLDLSNPYRAIPTRRTETPDGPVSEWTLPLSAFTTWAWTRTKPHD